MEFFNYKHFPGGTIYPGLMVTSTAIYHVMNALNLTVHVREICVFLAPLFSSLTVLVTYALTNELWEIFTLRPLRNKFRNKLAYFLKSNSSVNHD